MTGSTAIIEDVALEDLCEEAGQEAEDIECNGALTGKDKTKILDRLANNAQTKKHFQVSTSGFVPVSDNQFRPKKFPV